MPPRKQLAREQLTREQIENLSITDFAKIKLSNEEIRIAREIADERENERLDRVRRLSVELEPLLNELRAVGLNAATVRQIQVEALRRLRTIMENNGLGSDSLFT